MSRHGPKPLTLAALAVERPPAPAGAPSVGAWLGLAGRELVETFAAGYELSLTEARVVEEAGRAADMVAALRAAGDTDPQAQRLELAWSRHLATLLGSLHLEK